MLRVGRYLFKRAETSQEIEQVHRLNYRTFVSEIPQYEDPGGGRLVDKFHHKNTYFIALRDDRVVGMISTHDQPPFSIADRLSDASILQQPGIRPLEVRLLAVEPEERKGAVSVGLLCSVHQYVQTVDYTHLFISGLERRMDMYRQLGFEALGPAKGSGRARFVPMVLSLCRLNDRVQHTIELWQKRILRLS